MSKMYSARGVDSDQDQDNGFRQHLEGDGDDVEEHGFEPRLQPQDDIFVFKNTELPGLPKAERIRKLVVSEETKILVTESNKLYRWRTRIDAEFKAYELPQTSKENFLGLISTKERSALVRNIYIDPRGWHCVIAGDGGINYYLNYRDSKVKILKELKGVNIKAAAFHSAISETKSGDLLMAVDGGLLLLYRIELEQNGEVKEQNVLQYQLYLSSEVCSIQVLRLTQANGKNYVVVVLSTNSSLVCLTGPDDLEPLLLGYKNQTEKVREVQMPKSYQSMSQVCYSKLLKRPTAILWINNNALVRIRIPDADETVTDGFLSRHQALKWAKRSDQPENKAYQVQETPINVGVTDFHYYLLFQDSITIMSSITQRLVQHEEFKGSLVSDMAFERGTGVFWIFSNKGVIKLDTSREGNEAWKLLLEEKKYKEAYTVCKAKNENLSYVSGIYADFLFGNKQYQKAAIYFSQTSRTFQEIFLKFLQINSDQARDGLELYLKVWLKKLSPAETSQRCLLATWLIELMIYRLNRLERLERQGGQGRDQDARLREKQRERIRDKQRELEDLLTENLPVLKECEQLVYLVMQSHGRIQNLINFADRMNNFQMIVMHYLSEQAYEKALEYLKNVKDPKVVQVVYKYAHIFFRYQTEKTVALLTKSVRDFKPIKLMPGLMNIPDNKRVHGIQLLRYCVEELKSRDRSLHNILIFFYATSPKDKHPQLIELMKKGRLEFDLDFGLRLFKNYKMAEAQIIVFGKMYLYGEAVALALEHNKDELAKEYADRPEYEDERKKLWIQIAKHYLIKKGRISDVIQLTKQSKVVKIEDLLPHFNQNIKIENFKDEICQSLNNYSQEIGRLKSLMDSYSANAEQLKNELRMVKNRCIEIDSSQKCDQCFKTLFSQQFYIFPCMHGFHRTCLQTASSVHPTANAAKLRDVEAYSQDIKQLEQRILRKKQEQRSVKDTGGFSIMNALNIWTTRKDEEGSSLTVEKEQAELRTKKNQIDTILASQCLYCGPGIVDTITMPFDNESLRSSWKI